MGSTNRLRKWFWLTTFLTVAFMVAYRAYLHPLTAREIVRFETAKETSVASNIVEQWTLSPGKLDKAVNGIYLDFLFIILYTSWLFVACRFVSGSSRQPVLQKAGIGFSLLALIAGICDVVENICMLRSLSNHVANWSVRLAYDMALAKFSIIILSLLFIVTCGIFCIGRRRPVSLWS